ncbi:MAG: YidC/Oxa1 family insertase periplasmic-domain containing protein [Pirellulales bacterium]|nr:YidC/Oxa1 family insertase periplasmic-domain containing protein [Pirellulales bacterium]
MAQRFLTFMLIAMALLMFNNLLTAPRPKPDENPDAAKKNNGDKGDKQDGNAKVGAKPDGTEDPPPKKIEVDEGPREERRLTLGSFDPDSGYPMLVTLTTKGAAIERVELSNPQFRDIDDRSGYLGNLAPSTVKGGCLVNVVGDGTPAKQSGLQVGDVITAIDGAPVKGKESFQELMQATRPRQQIVLTVERAKDSEAPAEELSLDVPLVRRPLEVCRPEIENYNIRDEELPSAHVQYDSLLFTLQQINGSLLGDDEGELPGLDLRNAPWEVVDGATDSDVAFKRVVAEHALEIIKHYWLEKSEDELSYHLRFEIKIKNLADKEQKIAYRLDGPTGLPTEGYWYARKIGPNWFGGAGLRDFVMAHRSNEGYITGYNFVSATDIASEKKRSLPDENADRSLAFVGVDAQYFAAALLPDEREGKEIRYAKIEPLVVGAWNGSHKMRANISSRVITTPMSIAPGGTITQSYRFFAGPKQPDVLAKYDMQKLIVYGWFGWVARPMTSLLHVLNIGGNYGIAIILLTVIVRLCMFPLSRKQVMGAQKMQELQPEMRKISEKYKNDRPTLAKKQQELFRKHNYNPLSGCLLLFVQLPIFIGLYRALSIDIELRDAPLFSEAIRWCSNLTAPDMFYDWSGWMPDFIQGMLGPFLNLLPLFTVVLFLVQQKMFMPPPADDTAAMQQKIMTYMMIFIGFLFYTVASGLCVYFIVSSLWGIIERKVLPKTTPAAPNAAETKPTIEKTPKVKAMPKASGNGRSKSKQRQKKKGRR